MYKCFIIIQIFASVSDLLQVRTTQAGNIPTDMLRTSHKVCIFGIILLRSNFIIPETTGVVYTVIFVWFVAQTVTGFSFVYCTCVQ